jgi:flagellar biogenesis protein FliO
VTQALVLAWQGVPEAPAYDSGLGIVRAIVSLVVVLVVLGAFLWLLRRGTFSLGGRPLRRTMAVESAIALGDRRSLVIVNVEGRRLLLATSAANVSLITELAQGTFSETLEQVGAGPGHGSRA